MRRPSLFLFFIIQPFLVIGQEQAHYNNARDKIINKSWECVRFCINEECHTTEGLPKYISYFQETTITSWVGSKYKNRYRYCTAREKMYAVDSLNNYIKNSEPSDLPTWLFIDSNSNKEGLYIGVTRRPLYEDDGSGIEDSFFEIEFLSDTEYVFSWLDRLGTRRGYFKLYNTPRDFYLEHKIEPH